WEDYFESVAEGVSATKDTINDTVDECPESKIVVAGCSQGAMALRRSLLELGSVDSTVAGVLIGDGDKLPDDKVTTIDDYDTDDYEGIAQLARDQWDFDSGASEEPLPSDWESRILSACRGGDVVCALESFDVGSITDDISAHTNYDAEDWREFLADAVAGAS
ncbi:MAG: cutinase family protein, partial [Candidatus Corynebacterium faecigallinarum]